MNQRENTVLIGVRPQELSLTKRQKGVELQLLYRLDGNLNLLQAGTSSAQAFRKGQIMGIDCVSTVVQGDVEACCRQILGQCERHGYGGICCLFPFGGLNLLRNVVKSLELACKERFLSFYVSEDYGKDVERGKILVSTALSGGTLEGRFRGLMERFGASRIVMDIECMGEDFLLPAPKGCGDKLEYEEITQLMHRENASVFFSKELCARYFTYQNRENSLRFVLFDDQGTVREKIACARKWHLGGVAVTWGEVSSWNLL